MSKDDLAIPFQHKLIEINSFDLLGFTKIVQSGGEQYDEVRNSGRWDILRQIAGGVKR